MPENAIGSGNWQSRFRDEDNLLIKFFYVCFIIGLFLALFFFTTMGVEMMKNEKMRNELAVTPVCELEEEGVVKLHGTIECEYPVVITGTRDEGIWDGTARTFLLNDSGDMIPVMLYGSFGYPCIEVHDAPHVSGGKEEYLNGDSAYLIGDFRIEDGEGVLYLEDIATGENNFYHPRNDFMLIFVFTFLGTFFLGTIRIAFETDIYTKQRAYEWKSQAQLYIDLFKYSYAGIIVPVPIFFCYYLYSTEPLFLIPAVLFSIAGILAVMGYSRIRNGIFKKDHHHRWLLSGADGPEDAAARLRKILDKNKFRYRESKPKLSLLINGKFELLDHDLIMNILVGDPEDGTGLFIGVNLGPVTAENEYTVVRKLEQLIDDEFTERWT